MTASKRITVAMATTALVLGAGAASVFLFTARKGVMDPSVESACRDLSSGTETRITACTIAIEANPKAAWAYASRAEAYLRRNDTKSALPDVQAAIAADSKLAAGYALRAMSDTKAGIPQRKADAQQALKLIGGHPSAYENGQAYLAIAVVTDAADEKNEDADNTIKAYQTAMQADPSSVVNKAYYAKKLLEHDMWEEAKAQIEQLPGLDPLFAKDYLLMGNLWSQAPPDLWPHEYEYEESAANAIREYNKAIDLDPKMPDAYVSRATIHQFLRHNDEAVADFNKYLELAPWDNFSRNQFSMLLLRMGKLDQALAVINVILDKHPDSLKQVAGRALIYAAMGKRPEAIADVEHVLAKKPDDESVKKLLKYLQTGDRKLLSLNDMPEGIFHDMLIVTSAFLFTDVAKITASPADSTPDRKPAGNATAAVNPLAGRTSEASPLGSQDAASVPGRSYWSHNGSTLYLVADGKSRSLYYDKPKAGMVAAGAKPGSLLFSGIFQNGTYSGTAYIFNKRCGTISYQVSGPVSGDFTSITMSGSAPSGMDGDCSPTKHLPDTLAFTLCVKSPTSGSDVLACP